MNRLARRIPRHAGNIRTTTTMARAESRSPNTFDPIRHSGSLRPVPLSPSSHEGAGGQIPPSQYNNNPVPIKNGGRE
jgi:hypothetical protein